jgi:hypothetical protein
VDDQIRAIEEYVYGKYIEPGDHGTLDEESAVRVLDEFYSGPDADAAESYFPGVLWFELGFEQEDDESKQRCFLRAYHWLRRYRELSGEEWDPVDDRILDIEDWAEMVDVNLADHANPAVPPLPDTASSEEIVTVTAPAPAAPQAPQLAELVGSCSGWIARRSASRGS